MKTLDKLKELNAASIARRRAVLAWAATPPIKAILGTLEYLVETYQMTDYYSVDEGTIYAVLSVRDLEGLKDEKLAKLLDSLVHSDPTKSSTQDYAGNFERDYIFRWEQYNSDTYTTVALNVRVEAMFKQDSETCRRVVTGYTQPSAEPQPIYGLECVDTDAPKA